LFEKIMPLLKNATYIRLGGNGEPTIDKKFIKRINKIRNINPYVYFKLITNGIAFSDQTFAEKVLPIFDEMHISVNGISSYQKIMKDSYLKYIKKTFINIQKIGTRILKPIRVSVGFLLMRDNVQDIIPMAVIVNHFGFKEISYKDIWVYDDYTKNQSLRHDPKLAEMIKLKINKVHNYLLPNSGKTWFLCKPWPELSIKKNKSNHSNAHKSSQTELTNLDCFFPWENIQIFEDGLTLLCCNISTFIGNLKDSEFEEVWYGKEAQNYRKGMVSKDYYKACRQCKLIIGNEKGFERWI